MQVPGTHEGLPILLIVGLATLVAMYVGKAMRWLRLTAFLGFMLAGALLGPVLDVIHGPALEQLASLPGIAVGFIVLGMGLELNVKLAGHELRQLAPLSLGGALGAMLLVGLGTWAISGDWLLGLGFAAVAPAASSTGTLEMVARLGARGPLSRALQSFPPINRVVAVVSFAVIMAILRVSLEVGEGLHVGLWARLGLPAWEIAGGILIGLATGWLLIVLLRWFREEQDVLILLFSVILVADGVCRMAGTSAVLANLVVGLVLANWQPATLVRRVSEQLRVALPLVLILFFALAGANLRLRGWPWSVELIGAYIVLRSAGKLLGTWGGAKMAGAPSVIRRYLGFGALAQAGMAIGLALILKHQLADLGPARLVPRIHQHGTFIGGEVITVVAIATIVLEFAGPRLTRYVLDKAREIPAGKG